MQYYRCKCGASGSWGSIPPYRCTKCSKCGSNLAQSSEGHSEPEPHKFITRYDSHTGRPFAQCEMCMQRQDEIEKPEPGPCQRVQPPGWKCTRDHHNEGPCACVPTDPLIVEYTQLTSKNQTAQYPHCDMFVLHVQGTCEYCDMPDFKVLHSFRDQHAINHTGEGNPDKKPCPAEARRSKTDIDKWGGNVAVPPKPEGTWKRRFPANGMGIPERCNACNEPLLLESLFVDDGCPCNSPRGVNFEPKHCDICRSDDCVKPGHRVREIFGVAMNYIAEVIKPG